MKTRLVCLLFVALGWATTLFTPAVLSHFSYRISVGSTLPYLLSYTQNTDVRSSALYLLLVVAIAVVGVVIAELAKFAAPSRWVVASVFIFQIVLVTDCVRAFARDWWSYFFLLGAGRNVEQLSSMNPPPISAVMWPWISALVGAAAILVILFVPRSNLPANSGWQRTRRRSLARRFRA